MQIIEDTYRIFSKYPRYEKPKESFYDVSEDAQIQLQSIALQDFPLNKLGWLIRELGCLTWGDTVDLKHFLPRAMEFLLVDGKLRDSGHLSLLDFARALHRHDWQTWPDEEKECVENLLRIFWNTSLSLPVDICLLDFIEADVCDLLGALATCYDQWPVFISVHTLSFLDTVKIIFFINRRISLGSATNSCFLYDSCAQKVTDWLKSNRFLLEEKIVQALKTVTPEDDLEWMLMAGKDNLFKI